ncbi:30S ribosomal protein S3 [Candidatus Vidania fulgoroideorum]
MSKKINPYGFRLPRINSWKSRWNLINLKKNIYEDSLIRNYITDNFDNKYTNDIYIEKIAESYIVIIYSIRPGMVVGKNGKNIKDIKDFFINKKININIYIKEIKNIYINSDNLSKSICYYISKRGNYKKIINFIIDKAIQYSIRGIKICISGRLNGNDIARKENYIMGRVQLTKIDSKISYSKSLSNTKYGIICVKVWINF